MIEIIFLAAAITVADGDTFTIDGEEIRPVGFDAPEVSKSSCVAETMLAKLAKRRLGQLVKSPALRIERIRCKSNGPRCIDGIAHDAYSRTLARVYIGDEDVGDIMRREGYARKYRQNFRGKWCE